MGTSIEDWSSLVSPRWVVASLCFTGRNTYLILRWGAVVIGMSTDKKAGRSLALPGCRGSGRGSLLYG